MKKRYVLHVVGCVDPSLVGPYLTAKSRDMKAKKLRNADEDGGLFCSQNGIFWLNVTEKGEVTVGSYSGGFMDGIKGFNGSEE